MTPFFPDMIKVLRTQESVVLYDLSLNIPLEHIEPVVRFLEEEYKRESLDYPYKPPAFDASAAEWSAQRIYYAAQLILDRKQPPNDLHSFFPAFPGTISPAAMLTCDLLFRYLPDMIRQLVRIDADDPLIPILENLLVVWHYSGVSFSLKQDTLDFEIIRLDCCLEQLYINRVTHYRKLNLANHPALRSKVLAGLGMYRDYFWKNYH